MWQDVVIAVGSFCFSVALLPMLRNGADRPPLFTAVLTAFWLFVYTGTFITLGLWFSAATSLLNAGLWTTVGWKKWQSVDTATSPNA